MPTQRPELTRRQQEVLAEICAGHGNKVIADRLGISVKTVDRHRCALNEKLDAHNPVGLVIRAISTGYFSPEEIFQK